MSAGFIRMDIIGNVGKAETRPVGKDECLSFSVAVNRRQKKRDGSTDETTIWVQCSIWNDYARALAPYIAKGTTLFATGEPSFETYVDREQVTRTQIKLRVDKVQLCGSSEPRGAGQHRETRANDQGSRGYGAPRQQTQARQEPEPAPPPDDFGYEGGDEIPF